MSGAQKNSMLKSSILSLAVLVALTSCGKNKELKTPEGSAPKQETPAPVTPAPKADTGTVEADQKKNDGDDAQSDDQIKGNDDQAKQDGQQGQDQDQTKKPPFDGSFGENGKKDEGDADGDKKPDVKRPRKPAQKKLKDIKFDTVVADKTGGQAKDLYYTGAGDDSLMKNFKERATSVSEAQQKMNANLAKAIVAARLTKSGETLIDLAVDETINGQGAVKNYRLKATEAGNMLKLSLVSGNGDLEFQGGFLKCLDADGGCANAYAKIKMSGAYTRVIFRKSYANTYFLYQKDVVNNSAFETLKSYVLNSADGLSTSQKIDAVEVSSFEVLNGRGAMGLTLATLDKELIGLNIPLVVSANNSLVTAPVAKNVDIGKYFDLMPSAGYSTRLSLSISSVQLVGNTGVGQLKLKMTVGAGANAGAIWMVVGKVKKETLSVDQVAAFEATVKNF